MERFAYARIMVLIISLIEINGVVEVLVDQKIYPNRMVEDLELVKEKCLSVLCMQETNLEVVNEYVCQSLWGYAHYRFSYRPSFRGLRWYFDYVGC